MKNILLFLTMITCGAMEAVSTYTRPVEAGIV